MTIDEREFMKRLAPLVRTPRSAKRLINTYRLIRAPLSGDDLRQFLGGEGVKLYRVCLTLLAILIGFPDLAERFFHQLRAAEGIGWPDFVNDRLDSVDEEQAAWEALRRAIRDLGEDLPYRLEPYREWSHLVTRYSFQTVRLAVDEP